jgi:hypothetical protein
MMSCNISPPFLPEHNAVAGHPVLADGHNT